MKTSEQIKVQLIWLSNVLYFLCPWDGMGPGDTQRSPLPLALQARRRGSVACRGDARVTGCSAGRGGFQRDRAPRRALTEVEEKNGVLVTKRGLF